MHYIRSFFNVVTTSMPLVENIKRIFLVIHFLPFVLSHCLNVLAFLTMHKTILKCEQSKTAWPNNVSLSNSRIKRSRALFKYHICVNHFNGLVCYRFYYSYCRDLKDAAPFFSDIPLIKLSDQKIKIKRYMVLKIMNK